MVLARGRKALGRREGISLLAETRDLQDRVRRAVETNPDIPKYVLAQRFGLTAYRMAEFLAEDPVYPTSYKMIAGRIRRPIEEVTKHMELGERWCRHCRAWFVGDQFYFDTSFVHYAALCKRGKRSK